MKYSLKTSITPVYLTRVFFSFIKKHFKKFPLLIMTPSDVHVCDTS